MATLLFVQGLDPIELAEEESYNKARKRGNDVLKLKIDYENGSSEDYRPLHLLSFKTADGGRVCCQPDKFIGVGSDEEKDAGSSEE